MGDFEQRIDHAAALPDHPRVSRLRVPRVAAKVVLETRAQRPRRPAVRDEAEESRAAVVDAEAEELERARALVRFHLLDQRARRPHRVFAQLGGRQRQVRTEQQPRLLERALQVVEAAADLARALALE